MLTQNFLLSFIIFSSASSIFYITPRPFLFFPEPNRISKEYIGKFVDKLMQMPKDPHQDLEDIFYENTDSAMDVVAARILAEEKW